MARLRLATIWLGGCSGCHMSFLDMDEFLFDLAAQCEVVYSPLVDTKHYPQAVDVVFVEGAVANEDHLALIQEIREKSRLLVAFGDCAVTGNVTALRNPLHDTPGVLRRSYVELAQVAPQVPQAPGVLPPLVEVVQPVHRVVKVDFFLPGCPPPAPHIRAVVDDLIAGRTPQLSRDARRFG